MNDEFETAVVGTLADLAKVDRSTTEQVRASISLLPDRRSSRLSRIGRSISISPARRRPFAVAAALVIVVAVAGFSLLGRYQAQPVGPASPTPSKRVSSVSGSTGTHPSTQRPEASTTAGAVWTAMRRASHSSGGSVWAMRGLHFARAMSSSKVRPTMSPALGKPRGRPPLPRARPASPPPMGLHQRHALSNTSSGRFP